MQREINRLAGLYRSGLGVTDQPGASQAADELAAVAEQLLPLALASDNYPLREHARLAAERISELTIALANQGKERNPK